jgi:hypothetical protein
MIANNCAAAITLDTIVSQQSGFIVARATRPRQLTALQRPAYAFFAPGAVGLYLEATCNWLASLYSFAKVWLQQQLDWTLLNYTLISSLSANKDVEQRSRIHLAPSGYTVGSTPAREFHDRLNLIKAGLSTSATLSGWPARRHRRRIDR